MLVTGLAPQQHTLDIVQSVLYTTSCLLGVCTAPSSYTYKMTDVALTAMCIYMTQGYNNNFTAGWLLL